MWEMYWDLGLGLQTQFLVWFMFGPILAMKRIEPDVLSTEMSRESQRNAQWCQVT